MSVTESLGVEHTTPFICPFLNLRVAGQNGSSRAYPTFDRCFYGKKGERYVLYMTFKIDHSKGKEDLSKKPKH